MNEASIKFTDAAQRLLLAKPRKGQVSELEVLRPALLALRVDIGEALAKKREQMRMPNYKPDPKDKDTPRYTDFDRTTMLNAAVADLEAEYELVKGLENLVKERIEVIKWLSK